MFNDILVVFYVFVSLFVILQVMFIFTWWRNGTKYERMRQAYREMVAQLRLMEHRESLTKQAVPEPDDPPETNPK